MKKMDDYVKLSNQTIGKDKIARLFQYSSRFLWYHTQKKQYNPYTVDKLKSLEYTLSTFRKLLRLGKSVEVLYAALKCIHYEDAVVKYTSTMSKISSALFLLTDHILWFGRSGLATVNTSKWSEISNRYWLYSIFLNLVRDLYEISRILDIESTRLRSNRNSMTSNTFINYILWSGTVIASNHKDVFWDTIKNSCDVWIPLNALGYTNLNAGIIGILGTISSFAGLISVINPKAKLTPS